MATIREQLDAIEKEIRETPYHKGTEHHIGKLRAKISKLKAQEINKEIISKGGGGGGYAVKKQGDATIVLVGPPSVGKSTLLTKLTNAKSKIAPYAFTTLTVIPGMMHYKNANIQILDVPGIIGDAEKGKGRGREVLSVARGADLIIILTDIENLDEVKKIEKSLYGNGIRLDVSPPLVTIDKKIRGNIQIHSNFKQDLDSETIRSVAYEFGFRNADVTVREKLTMERLIDAFASNRVYLPSLIVINKSDMNRKAKLPSAINISAELEEGLDILKDRIWNMLSFVRVYLVKRNEEPSKNNPIIVVHDKSLGKVVSELGSNFAEDTQRAKIWGNGAKFPGQVVSLSTKVKDGMMVRFI